MGEEQPISTAAERLDRNVCDIVTVNQWATMMGYECPKRFARKFQRHFMVRPAAYLKYVRLKKITEDLRSSDCSNFVVARKYGVPDEIALNKYFNYHLDCSPTKIKQMKEIQLQKMMEKFGSKVR
mgnify:CR=1 FL=1